MNAEEQILFSIWSVVARTRERGDPEMLKSALRTLRVANSEFGRTGGAERPNEALSVQLSAE